MTGLVVLGLVCWLVTEIVTGSEIFRPARDYVGAKEWKWQHISNAHRSVREQHPHYRQWEVFWRKLSYLVRCQLCAGTWIGLSIAWVTSYRLEVYPEGFVGFLLAGLAIKAVGHITLEVTALLARLAPRG